MGLKTAQNIIDDAEEALQDQTNDIWREEQHLKAFNDGQRAIVNLKPSANIVTKNALLVAGTKQALAAGDIFLFDIVRNMGTTGTTVGDAIHLVARQDMDETLPGWHKVTASATVAHWMYDPKIPKTFYVYPPQPASAFGYVEQEVAQLPADIDINDTITLEDSYSDALVAYLLYRAWSKKNPQLAAGYFTLFEQLLGVKKQNEQQDDPNIGSVKGGMP